MAKKEEGYSSSSFWQLMLVIPGTIIGFTLLISILAHFFGSGESAAPAPAAAAPVAAVETKVDEAIKPVAEVQVADTSGAKVEKTGEEVVKAVCSMCHAAGLMESPKLGDKGQWAPRIAQGYETLVKHAIEGIRNMPARGGNPDLSDTEVASAVAHMANAAGANFDPATLKK
ncbi:cytochrome c5 [Methylophilaceae bacterium 11]|uniref:c-type cytochrome n=1 Tax=Methylotenera sp. 1P/1 TaxID=1131551 RepID=UPI00037F7769|nr:c-type cytochrome [Methylotenera sp. 1P/1]EUJ09748.1 cytochrome c5 [Methylophilaceae bacterium 11]